MAEDHRVRFMRAYPPRQRAISLGAAVLIVALSWGCGSGSDLSGSEEAQRVEGLVVEVVDRNIEEVESLRVRDQSGMLWTFTTEGYAGFTPAHLREHQLFGSQVVVSYRSEKGPDGDRLVAVDITDPPD